MSLAASATTVPVGQSVTLTANATDNVGVTKVEFFRNAVKIGEDSMAPFAFMPPAFTDADIGSARTRSRRWRPMRPATARPATR